MIKEWYSGKEGISLKVRFKVREVKQVQSRISLFVRLIYV